MFSKRMVISMIVIGCLVQFMTCAPEKRQIQAPNSPSRRLPESKPPAPSTTKPSAGRPTGLSKPRAVPTPKNAGPTDKTPTSDLSKKPTGPKKPEAVSRNANNNYIAENEGSDEQPVSGFRKFFRKLNGIRKYACPFKIASKIYGKGKRLKSRMMKAIGVKSSRNDDKDNSDPN